MTVKLLKFELFDFISYFMLFVPKINGNLISKLLFNFRLKKKKKINGLPAGSTYVLIYFRVIVWYLSRPSLRLSRFIHEEGKPSEVLRVASSLTRLLVMRRAKRCSGNICRVSLAVLT